MESNRRAKADMVALKEEKLKLLKVIKDLEASEVRLPKGESEISELSESAHLDGEGKRGQIQSIVEELSEIRQINRELYSHIHEYK
jgi:hypothetical protein